MVWSIVLYLLRPLQDLTDLETVWDLLQGGSIGSQGMGDPVYLLAFYAVVDCRMTSTRLHVA